MFASDLNLLTDDMGEELGCVSGESEVNAGSRGESDNESEVTLNIFSLPAAVPSNAVATLKPWEYVGTPYVCRVRDEQSPL